MKKVATEQQLAKVINNILNNEEFTERFLDEVYADMTKQYKESAKKLLSEVAPELKFENFKKWEISAEYNGWMICLCCKITNVKHTLKPMIRTRFYASAKQL